MPQRFRQIREFLDTLPHDNKAASGPDVIKRDNHIHDKVIAKNVQKPDVRNKIQALAGKQPEFNRGKGTQRHPHSPPQKVTGPNELGSMSEENQENHMKKTFKEIREGHEITTVKKHQTPGGPIVVARRGNSYTAVLHPEHIKAIRELPTAHSYEDRWNPTHRHHFKDEQGHTWSAHKEVGHVHLIGTGSNSNYHMSFPEHHLNEARNNEYNANMQLSSSKGSRKPGHYLMRHGVPLHNEPHSTSQQALSAYHNLSDKSNVKIQHVKEEAPAMAAGAAGDPGHVQNASDNYASQRKTRLSMLRRKNPLVGSNNNQNLS